MEGESEDSHTGSGDCLWGKEVEQLCEKSLQQKQCHGKEKDLLLMHTLAWHSIMRRFWGKGMEQPSMEAKALKRG